MSNKKPFDFGIFLTVLILVTLGLIMVFSASAPRELARTGNSYNLLVKQLMWAILGFIAMTTGSKFDYRKLKKLSGIIFIISLVLLVAVLIPGVGVKINGSTRWINLGITQLQPSEVAKLGIILFFSATLAQKGENMKNFKKGLLPYLIMIGLVDGLLLLEPHMSSAGVITLIGVILLFAAGARIWHFTLLGVAAAPLVGLMVMLADYRMQRVTAFLHPWDDPKGDNYQVIQSLFAIGSGRFFGLGLGRSRQKFSYLPEAHNDFIFSKPAS